MARECVKQNISRGEKEVKLLFIFVICEFLLQWFKGALLCFWVRWSFYGK